MHTTLGVTLFLLGVAMLLIAITDLLWTTFLEGGPPVTTRVCHHFIRRLLTLQRQHRRRVVAMAGLIAVITTLVTWTFLLCSGWTLIFSASHGALVSSDAPHEPVDEWSRVYFVGSTVFTLGMGDVKPHGHVWQMAAAVAAGSGFLMFGMALAYLMAVVPAATQKRQLAVCIWALGKTPDDIIIRAWNGADTSALAPHLVSLVPMLALLGESHLSYPVLHYFHSTKRSASLASSVAALDEAITILECGLQKGCSLDVPALGAAREAITEFLQTLKPALIDPAHDEPPVPSLKMLKDMGVPVVDDELFRQSLNGLKARRRLLLALVRNEGWTWKAVWPEGLSVMTSTASEPVEVAT